MRTLIAGLILLVATVAACGGGSSAASGADRSAEAWRTALLRDVVTGTEFRIDDLRGRVVAIETMAIWCSTCRIQQHEAQAALAELGSEEIVYISLDVDPRERVEDLAAYAAREGFAWRFAVASPEVSRSLATAFGDQILSPPSTPMVILDRDGVVAQHHVGIRGADELAALFRELLG